MINASLPPPPPPSASTPPPPPQPEPSRLQRIAELAKKLKNNKYVQAVTYGYAAYKFFTEGQVPGRIGVPLRDNEAEEKELFLGQLEQRVPGFANAREALLTLRERFGLSGMADDADLVAAIRAEFLPMWLADP